MADQKNQVVVSLLSTAAAVTGYAPTYVDLAPSSIVMRRQMRLIVVANGVSGSTPSFGVTLTECATTNGTYTTVAGETITAITTDGLGQYLMKPSMRYIKAALGNPTGTGTPTASVFIGIVNEYRQV